MVMTEEWKCTSAAIECKPTPRISSRQGNGIRIARDRNPEVYHELRISLIVVIAQIEHPEGFYM